MDNQIHTFSLNIDFKLMAEISRIDKFGGAWLVVEKREGRSLKQLKSVPLFAALVLPQGLKVQN